MKEVAGQLFEMEEDFRLSITQCDSNNYPPEIKNFLNKN